MQFTRANTRLEVVDARQPLANLRKTHPDRYAALFDKHMTGEGNAFIAGLLARAHAGSTRKALTLLGDASESSARAAGRRDR